MMQASSRDRLYAGIGTAVVLPLVGGLLVLGLNVRMEQAREATLVLFTVQSPAPPPRPIPPPRKEAMNRPAKQAPSPANLRNRATEVVTPPPVVLTPAPPKIAVAPVADLGAAAQSGASDRAGPGYGAGGEGDGRGGGGDGEGGGTPPRQIRGKLKFSDIPPDLRETLTAAQVDVRYRVNVDGSVSGCTIDKGSGIPRIDALTCQLIEQRFHFKPSRDSDGTPVRSTVIETHEWVVDRRLPDGR